MGFLVDGQLYGFNTPLDLLRFRALSLPDRVRTGLGALYITKLKRARAATSTACARSTGCAPSSARASSNASGIRCCAPSSATGVTTVPAYWVWNTLNREKDGGQEVKGYLRCGYAVLAEALRDAVVARGGEVRTRCPVDAIEEVAGGVRVTIAGGSERFDAVVSTLPMPLLARVARGALADAVPLSELRYQGVVNALVVSRARLERFYWTAVVDPALPVPGRRRDDARHPARVGRRPPSHLPDELLRCRLRAVPALRRRRGGPGGGGTRDALPAVPPPDVEAVYVFRAPHVEPAWTLGYLRPASGAARGPQPALSVHHCPGVSARHCLEYQRGAGAPRRPRPCSPISAGPPRRQADPCASWSRLARGGAGTVMADRMVLPSDADHTGRDLGDGRARAAARGDRLGHAQLHQGHAGEGVRARVRNPLRRCRTRAPSPPAPPRATPRSRRSIPSRATRSSPRRSPTWARSRRSCTSRRSRSSPTSIRSASTSRRRRSRPHHARARAPSS